MNPPVTPRLRRVGRVIPNLKASLEVASSSPEYAKLESFDPFQMSADAKDIPSIPYAESDDTSSLLSPYLKDVIDLRRRLSVSPRKVGASDANSVSSSTNPEKTFHELINRIGGLQDDLEEERDRVKALEKILRSKDKRIVQLEDNDKFWRDGYARQGKEMDKLEKSLAARDKWLTKKDKEINEITTIRLQEFDERVRLRRTLEQYKRRLSAYENVFDARHSSTPDTTAATGSTDLHPIAEENSKLYKRISIREFNRRAREIIQEKEEKLSRVVEEKKNIIGKRISMDAMRVRSVTGSVSQKVKHRMSMSQMESVGEVSGLHVEPKQKPRQRNVLRKKFSFEPSGRVAASAAVAAARPSINSRLRKKVSFDNLGQRMRVAQGAMRKGAEMVLNGGPRAQ